MQGSGCYVRDCDQWRLNCSLSPCQPPPKLGWRMPQKLESVNCCLLWSCSGNNLSLNPSSLSCDWELDLMASWAVIEKLEPLIVSERLVSLNPVNMAHLQVGIYVWSWGKGTCCPLYVVRSQVANPKVCVPS
jgi:hypothetical protein